MSSVLTNLLQQVKPEQIEQLETPKLADHLLIALKDCGDIRGSSIISAEALQSALGYEHDYPPRPPVISESEGNKILMELMAAWEWLKREVYLIPRPDDMFGSRMISGGEGALYITKRGRDRIAELANQTAENNPD